MNFVFNQSGDGNTQIGSIGRGPEWVRTADRLPTVKDGGQNGDVLAVWTFPNPHQVVAVSWRTVCESDEFTYWMPLPKLPEVER